MTAIHIPHKRAGGPGRGLGTKNGQSKSLNRWRPLKWRPEYDRVAAYSACGKSNIWIAQQLGFTPQHVSNLLQMPEAVALIDKIQKKFQESAIESIPNVMLELAEQSVRRLKSVMFNDDLFERNPFAIVDRGLDILKGIGHLRGGGNGALQPSSAITNIGQQIIVTPSQYDSITQGLEKVAEVKKLHAGN